MNSGFIGILIALIVAAVASAIDLTVHRDKGLYLRAVPLCALFIIFDSSAAIILLIPLRTGAEQLESSPTTAAAVAAGLVGPLLMRTRIPVPFTKGERMVNAVAMLRRLQIRVAAEINDVCAVGETAWLLDKVLPALGAVPLSDVETWVIESINVKYAGVEGRKLRDNCVKDIKRAANDPVGQEERKHILVQILIDRCGRRPVIALVKRTKKRAKNPKHLRFDESSQTKIEPIAETTNGEDSAAETNTDDPSGGSTGEASRKSP